MAKKQPTYLTDEQKAEVRQTLNAEKYELQREQTFLKTLARSMSTEDGKEIVKHIVQYCKPYDKGFVNSGESAFNAGKQDVGRYLIKQSIRAGHELTPTECIDEQIAQEYRDAISNLTDDIHIVQEQLNNL